MGIQGDHEELEQETGEGQAGKETQKAKTKKTVVNLGHVLDGIYAASWKMIEVRATLDTYSGLSGAIKAKLEAKLGSGSNMKGWGFYDLVDEIGAQVHSTKIKDSGWLDLARDLEAVFLFGNGFGEFLQPHEGSCCCHFQTLPKGQNYLAVGIAALDRLVDKWQGPHDTDAEEVRLSRELCWDSPVKPFRDTACGPRAHLDKFQPSCFPIQLSKRIPLDKENKPVKGATLIRRAQFKEMLRKYPNGVGVFGKKQPQGETLKKMAQAMVQASRSSGTQQRPSGTSRPAASNNNLQTRSRSLLRLEHQEELRILPRVRQQKVSATA